VIEKRAGDIRVADAFEEAEEADAIVVELVVQAVDDGTDSSQDFTRCAVAGQIGFDLAVLVERIFLVEAGLDVYEQRRNPDRISSLDLPREVQ